MKKEEILRYVDHTLLKQDCDVGTDSKNLRGRNGNTARPRSCIPPLLCKTRKRVRGRQACNLYGSWISRTDTPTTHSKVAETKDADKRTAPTEIEHGHQPGHGKRRAVSGCFGRDQTDQTGMSAKDTEGDY